MNTVLQTTTRELLGAEIGPFPPLLLPQAHPIWYQYIRFNDVDSLHNRIVALSNVVDVLEPKVVSCDADSMIAVPSIYRNPIASKLASTKLTGSDRHAT